MTGESQNIKISHHEMERWFSVLGCLPPSLTTWHQSPGPIGGRKKEQLFSNQNTHTYSATLAPTDEEEYGEDPANLKGDSH